MTGGFYISRLMLEFDTWEDRVTLVPRYSVVRRGGLLTNLSLREYGSPAAIFTIINGPHCGPFIMVEMTGVEPATSCLQSRRSTN